MERNHSEYQYLDLLNELIESGTESSDRTGNGTRSVMSRMLRFDLSKGFPLFTTKKVYVKGVLGELMWFLSGSTNIKPLVENDIHIWDKDAYRWARELGAIKSNVSIEQFIQGVRDSKTDMIAKKPRRGNKYVYGDLGNVYGYQWLGKGVNQVEAVLDEARKNPSSRRLMLVSWDPVDMDPKNQLSALPCCHYGYQLYIRDGRVNLQYTMRSSDVFLGLPFNVASYAFLTHMYAHLLGMQVGELVHVSCDTHLYNGHINAAKEQVTRTPRDLPQLNLSDRQQKSFADFSTNDFQIIGYDPHPAIKAVMFT